MDKSSLNIYDFEMFSPILCAVFTFLMTLFESQKVLILVTSKLFLIAIACTFGVTSKESFPSPSLKKFISMFYSDSFTV